MSRRRYISTEISIDEAVNRMGMKYGDTPVLLYTWMIPHASDDATVNGNPYELLGMVWPNRRDKTEEDIIRALEQMEEFRLVVWDRGKHVVYFPIHSFYKHQTYIKKENRRTAENAEEHRTTATNSDEQRESAQNAVSLSLPHSLPLSHSKDSSGDHAGPSELEVRIQRFYEQAFANMPTEIQVSRLTYWCEKGMEEPLVLQAISRAAEKCKDFDYVVGTLRKQYERGIRTIAESLIDDARFQTAAGGDSSGKYRAQSTRYTETDQGAEIYIQKLIDNRRGP